MRLSDWQRNRLVFQIDSFFDWFFIPVGIWVLALRQLFSFTEISLIMSTALLWSVVLDLPSGALADLIGRKNTVLIGRMAVLGGYVLLFFNHSFWAFMIYQLSYQTDTAFTSGAQSALLYDSLKEQGKGEQYYKKTEAQTYLTNTLGMAVASIIGGFLYRTHFLWPYYVMVIPTTISIIAACFYDEPSHHHHFTVRSYWCQNIEGIKHIFANQKIRAVSLYTIAVNVVAYCGLWYLYEPRLAAGGFAAQTLAYLVSGTYLVRALGTKLIAYVDKRLAHYQTPIFLAIFQTVGSAVSFITTPWAAIASVYLRKASDGYRQPTVITLQNDNIASQYRATSLSALNLIGNFLIAIIGLFIGLSIDHFGAANTLGFFAVVGVLIVLPAAVRLSKIMAKG